MTTTINLKIPFESLSEVINSLDLSQKQQLLEILEQHMHVPEQVENDVFIHSNQDNKYSMPDLPYVASFEEFLLVCS